VRRAAAVLARLRHNGLITRCPHTNTYDLTVDGLAFAIFYTKIHDRVLRPLFATGQPKPHPSSAQPCTKSNKSSMTGSPQQDSQQQQCRRSRMGDGHPIRTATSGRAIRAARPDGEVNGPAYSYTRRVLET
jgi:hypothetical protein